MYCLYVDFQLGLIVGNFFFDVIDFDFGVILIYVIDCLIFIIDLNSGVIIFRFLLISYYGNFLFLFILFFMFFWKIDKLNMFNFFLFKLV